MSEGRYTAGLETRTKLVLLQLAFEAGSNKAGVCGVSMHGTNSIKELMQRNLVAPLFTDEQKQGDRRPKRYFVGFGFTLRGNAAVHEIGRELLAFAGMGE